MPGTLRVWLLHEYLTVVPRQDAVQEPKELLSPPVMSARGRVGVPRILCRLRRVICPAESKVECRHGDMKAPTTASTSNREYTIITNDCKHHFNIVFTQQPYYTVHYQRLSLTTVIASTTPFS